jgi:enamine deaminase RidA (YjgF/YER057c/UK114 family)
MSTERFSSGGPYEQIYGYSRVVRAGDRLVTAGCTATVDGVVTGAGDPHAQTVTAFRVALDALARAGASVRDVIRTRMYVTDRARSAGRTARSSRRSGRRRRWWSWPA